MWDSPCKDLELPHAWAYHVLDVQREYGLDGVASYQYPFAAPFGFALRKGCKRSVWLRRIRESEYISIDRINPNTNHVHRWNISNLSLIHWNSMTKRHPRNRIIPAIYILTRGRISRMWIVLELMVSLLQLWLWLLLRRRRRLLCGLQIRNLWSWHTQRGVDHRIALRLKTLIQLLIISHLIEYGAWLLLRLRTRKEQFIKI